MKRMGIIGWDVNGIFMWEYNSLSRTMGIGLYTQHGALHFQGEMLLSFRIFQTHADFVMNLTNSNGVKRWNFGLPWPLEKVGQWHSQ